MTYKLPLMALLSLLTLSGCVVYGDGTSRYGASDAYDITINLNFDRQANCFRAGVDTVRVSFSGNRLESVTVPCNQANGIAVKYQGVFPGSYTAFVDALDNGQVVYSGQFQFVVSPDVTSFLFDLPPANGGSAELVTNFTFAAPSSSNTGGMTCDEARVSVVNVTIDNGTPIGVPCHDNRSNRDAAAFSNIAPGTHVVQFEVVDTHGNTLYASRYDNIVISSGSNEYDVNVLGVAKGGLQIQWVFSDASSCSQAGVATVDYQLTDASGRPVKSGTVSCATSGGAINAITLSSETGSPLAAGIYSLNSLVGRDSRGNAVYDTGSSAVSGLYVPAGDLQAFQVTLRRY